MNESGSSVKVSVFTVSGLSVLVHSSDFEAVDLETD
jgi:hypothetical protein